MTARRTILTTWASVCVLLCGLAVGVHPAGAATEIGSQGAASGQFKEPSGVAINQATGENVYVADRRNRRIDEFDASGAFLMATGWGVVNGATEAQTCTAACQPGIIGTAGGQFSEGGPIGLAIDNDPLSTSYGDVYVVDGDHNRVEKFDSSGNFLLTFGGDVNETTGGNLCVAGEACKSGTEGEANGQFDWNPHATIIAVGSDGMVYVGDKARVQIFDPSGLWNRSVSTAALSSTGKVTALAVDGTGDIFLSDNGDTGVHEFDPAGSLKSTVFDAGSTTEEALAVGASGEVFISDTQGGFHILEYSPAGEKLASFGQGTLYFAQGIAFAPGSNDLYLAGYKQVGEEGGPNNRSPIFESAIDVVPVPTQGPPVVEPGSVSAIPGRGGHTTVEATIDPEGNATSYRVEYVDEADFKTSGYSDASSTPEIALGSEFEDKLATDALSELVPGGSYHYRVVATNSAGTDTSPDQVFTTIPPALIEGPWVTNVTSTSATFSAQIDPFGKATEYRLEYGTTTAYGQTLLGSVGEEEAYVPITYHRQGLSPDVTYHYRIVVHNEVGVFASDDHTFITQGEGSQEVSLPDGRAWELVSPPDKKGALIESFATGGEIQAANDGSGITYLTTGPTVGQNPSGKLNFSQVLSRRGPGGWGSEDIVIPREFPDSEQSGASIYFAGYEEYRLFSPDLSSAVVSPFAELTPSLAPGVTERTLYLRDNVNGRYQALVSDANVPAGTKFGGSSEDEGATQMHFLAATPDLRHVVLESPLPLTPEASSSLYSSCHHYCGAHNLYEWSEGQLKLINILPDGEPVSPAEGSVNVLLGATESLGGAAVRAISNDGRRVMWTLGDPYGNDLPFYKGLYMRDTVEEKTVRVGGAFAVLQTISGDGSKVFYRENGDLHVFYTNTDTDVDITANHGGGETSAGTKEAVLGASENGDTIYFVGTGVLTNNAVKGEDNLYVSHYDGSTWMTTLVGTLSSEDEQSWYDEHPSAGVPDLSLVSSRVSTSGRYLTFMSSRPLTGYDNIDALSGRPDEEVYLYDADSAHLACVSCDPTGARPVGLLDEHAKEPHPLVDSNAAWGRSANSINAPHWLAGNIPGWDSLEGQIVSYQPRYLLNDGRLFFDSPEALVPQDTNGLEDVYEYEPAGVGGCTAVEATFSERSGGCTNLISSGTSGTESDFFDASESGDDVFFITTSRLTSADYDTGYDVYDAHVCTPTAPCISPPVSSPACTSGDSCKAAPSPQPEIFGPTPSATFSGAGNVLETTKTNVIKHKVKRKPKSRRRAKHQKRKARKAGSSRNGNASRKGGR